MTDIRVQANHGVKHVPVPVVSTLFQCKYFHFLTLFQVKNGAKITFFQDLKSTFSMIYSVFLTTSIFHHKLLSIYDVNTLLGSITPCLAPCDYQLESKLITA